MKSRGIVRVMLLVLILGCLRTRMVSCDQAGESWKNISIGVAETDLRTVSADTSAPDTIYAGSAKGMFKSTDNGKSWQRLYPVRGLDTKVNAILIDPENPVVLYAATGNGLFKSPDSGMTWNKAFEGLGDQEKDIRHMAMGPKTRIIYLGTGSGAFTSKDEGKSWNKINGETSGQMINFIMPDPSDPSIVYMAAAAGIYKTKDGGSTWERIYNVSAQTEVAENAETLPDTNTDETEPPSARTPNCILVDNKNTSKIYIGTWSGIFFSADSGATWEKMTGSGLLNRKINCLLLPDDRTIYAATDGGVFTIAAPYIHWDEVYNGLTSKTARCLAYDKKDNAVLAATKKGIFEICVDTATDPGPGHPLASDDPGIKKILLSFDDEPAIREVQEAAIKYAEVHKEKIDQWRKAAKQKAFLPNVNVGLNRELGELYHWDAGPNPDILQKGKDAVGWDVSLSWNLGELIWNNDQNNIDVRSRLMVQLRDDVLNEVTRLYFERRRLQVNLMTNPSNNSHINLERELRLQELTAGIDGLTGGWFSKKVERP